MLYLKKVKEAMAAIAKIKTVSNDNKNVFIISENHSTKLYFYDGVVSFKYVIGEHNGHINVRVKFTALNKVVKMLKNNFNIFTDDFNLEVIESDSSIKYNLVYDIITEYLDTTDDIETEKRFFVGNIRNLDKSLKTLLAIKADKDERRPHIVSILLRGNKLISTDGKQLVEIVVPNMETQGDILIDKELITPFTNLLNQCVICDYKSIIVIKNEKLSLKIKKIYGEFLPADSLNRLFEYENESECVVNKKILDSLVKLLKVDEDMHCKIQDNKTIVSSKDHDISASFEITDLKIKGYFNNKMLTSFLKTIDLKEVTTLGLCENKIMHINSSNIRYCLMSKQDPNK